MVQDIRGKILDFLFVRIHYQHCTVKTFLWWKKVEILVLEEKDGNNKTNLESTKVKNIPWYKRRSENCINQILLRVKLIYKQGPQ